MHNQICPWRSENDSFIFESHSAILQKNNAGFQSTPNSVHKKVNRHKRPQTSDNFYAIKGQKEIQRPLSCQKSLKLQVKALQQSQHSFKRLEIATIQVSQINQKVSKIPASRVSLQFNNNNKKIVRAGSALFSRYSSFIKCKLKKSERPQTIFFKNIAHTTIKIKQKNNPKLKIKIKQIQLNSKLFSILKLAKLQAVATKSKLLQAQKNIELKPKKLGFVYYNQSFADKQQFNYA